MTHTIRRFVAASFATILAAGGSVYLATAGAASTPGQYPGPSAVRAGTAPSFTPSGDKPESKLWYAAGYWWADMWSTTVSSHDIFQLDRTQNQWVDTGVPIDSRLNTNSDALWDGTHLYVASHVFAQSSTDAVTGKPARLFRYSLSGTTWTPDAGFPVDIEPMSVESMTIALEGGTNRLFATWTQGTKVFVTATAGAASASSVSFGQPLSLSTLTPTPVPHSGDLLNDDISTMIAYPGHLMVMWSDQKAANVGANAGFYYAIHKDGDPSGAWTGGTATSGVDSADDHINLKTANGLVYAVVKTSFDQVTPAEPTAPLIELLVFTPAGDGGSWSTPYTVSTVADGETRPILQLDPTDDQLYVFVAAPDAGTPIRVYEKTTTMSSPQFAAGRGAVAMSDSTSLHINNPSGSKQTVDSTTGLVVIASDATTQTYWYFDDGQGSKPPVIVKPTASFTATPTTGPAPLTVQFSDTSTGTPTSWTWDFGDGSAASTAQNPSHVFASSGTFTVKLTAANADGSTSATKAIVVTSSGGGGGGGGGGTGGGGGGGGGTGGAGGPATVAGVSRVAGADRYATAVAASEAQFPNGNAGAVVLARGDDYPDALVGAPLAKAKNAPLLLTTGATMPSIVTTELQRVLPSGGTVYVLGSTAAVPASIASEITGLGYQVVRYGGADRFATAVAIADALGDPGTVLLATGTNFPDALAAGPAAAHLGGVVLLTSGSQIPAATAAYLSAHSSSVYAVGGPAATADPTATPVFGADRYATAAVVAARFFSSPVGVGVATGLNFPDALSGGALLARGDDPLLLATTTALPNAASAYLASVAATTAYLFGDTNALAASVSSAVANVLGT